jgi:hypothetical protein
MLEAAVSERFGASYAADPESKYQCEGYDAGSQAH